MRTHIALPEPIGIYPYFDKIQFWVRKPLDQKAIGWLGKQCGQGGIHTENRPARFNRRYRQRIELRQPTKKALQWLVSRDDALINRGEIAFDLVFKYRAERDEAWEFLHQHLIRRWHAKTSGNPRDSKWNKDSFDRRRVGHRGYTIRCE
jgi:hypothetical protein